MRLLSLPDILRNAGLVVHEYPDWRTRGASTFGPVEGIVCHGTGSASWTTSDAGELRVIAITGSNSAPAVPISQLYLSRSGEWWVVASGTATGVRTGTGGPLVGKGDDSVLQIEAQHASNEPWSDTQYWSYVRGVRALMKHKEPNYNVPLEHVIGHGEHQPGQKFDPWFDMNQFRADVAAETGEFLMALTEEQQEDLYRRMCNIDSWMHQALSGGKATVEGLRYGYGVGTDQPPVPFATNERLTKMETDIAEIKRLLATHGGGGGGETGTAQITGGTLNFGPVE